MVLADFRKEFLGIQRLKELPNVVVRHRDLKRELHCLEDLALRDADLVCELILLRVSHHLEELALALVRPL